MKKKLLILLPALAMLFFVTSCSKEDTQPQTNTTPEGKWNGTYTPVGGTASFFSINFNTGGTLTVEANSTTTPDLATGTYTVVGDTIQGTFTYTIGIGIIYNFKAAYTSGSTAINGTIGISPSYVDNATFTLTKQ